MRRLLIQFRLRTVLLLFIPTAIFLWYLSGVLRRAEQQKMAVESLQQLGFYCYYDNELDRLNRRIRWNLLRKILGDHAIDTVTGVRAQSYPSSINNATLRKAKPHLDALTSLELVELNDSSITDEGLRELTAIKPLKILDLRRVPSINGSGLCELTKLENLEELLLAFDTLSPNAIDCLANFPAIKKIEIIGATIPVDARVNLRRIMLEKNGEIIGDVD